MHCAFDPVSKKSPLKRTVTYIFSHVIPCKFSVCALHLSLWPIWSSFWLKLLSSLSRFTFFLACGCVAVSVLFAEEMILLILYCFCSGVKCQLTLFVQVYFWALYGLAFYLQIRRSCLVSPADPPHAQGSTYSHGCAQSSLICAVGASLLQTARGTAAASLRLVFIHLFLTSSHG